MKIVRYNGGTISCHPCTEPTELVIGKEYKVIDENDRGDYTLKDVNGFFNSCWFEEVPFDSVPTFMAIAHTVPTVGEVMRCCKIEFSNNKPQFQQCSTATVTKLRVLGNNIYEVTTVSSVWLVKVG